MLQCLGALAASAYSVPEPSNATVPEPSNVTRGAFDTSYQAGRALEVGFTAHHSRSTPNRHPPRPGLMQCSPSSPSASSRSDVNARPHATLAIPQFAHFSNAAYCPLDSISSWSCKPCTAADPSFTAKTFSSSKTGMH
eukprot:129574-Prymnesium_polylepis.1